MKLRTTLIMLFVLAVVGGAWWLTRGISAPQAPTTDDAQPTPLFPEGALDVSSIDRFVIERPGKDRAVFTKTRGRWRIVEPVGFEADATTVNQLLQSIASLRDLGQAGPSPTSNPLARVTLQSDAATTVSFGDSVGAGLGRVHLDEGPPRLIDDILHDFLKRYDPVDLLSKQLATPTAYNTQAVTIETPQGQTRLDRNAEGWIIDQDPEQPALNQPVPGYIDVEGYLNIPNATKIERFLPIAQGQADPAGYGLTDQGARVRIEYTYQDALGEEQAATLRIGAPADPQRQSYYASFTRSGEAGSPVFVLSAEFSIVMAKQPDDFRDPRVFLIGPTEIERIEVAPPGSDPWALDLTDGRGSLLASGRIGGASDLLREPIGRLLGVRALGYRDLRTLEGLWERPTRITVIPTRNRPAQPVTIYFPDDDATPDDPALLSRCLATSPGRAFGLLIDRSAVEALLALQRRGRPLELADPE